jgi:hypothetical protein
MVRIASIVACLVALCFVCLSEQGGYLQHRRAVQRAVSVPPTGDPCTSCTNELFNAAGYDLTGWTEGGAAGTITNKDYATAPAPIEGSQSLLLKNVGFGNVFTYINMPNTAEVWLRFAIVITNSIVNGVRVCFIGDSGFTQVASVEVRSSGLRIVCGTANATTVATLNPDKTNYVWVHYLKGSGANAVADVAFREHPTKTRPASGNNFAQVTTGTSTANQQQCGPYVSDVDNNNSFGGIIYDNFSLTTIGQIGDVP